MGSIISFSCLPCQYYYLHDSECISNSCRVNDTSNISEDDIEQAPSSHQNQVPAQIIRGKRGHVSEEILSSERNFVRHFNVMESIYYQPLQRAGVMEATILRDQFSDYFVIKGIHRCLLGDLERGDSSITAIFAEYVPSFKLYKEYLRNYERRLKDRAILIVSNHAFKLFLSSLTNSPHGKGQTMESLFVEPVQRLPRYKLLLQEVIAFSFTFHYCGFKYFIECAILIEYTTLVST